MPTLWSLAVLTLALAAGVAPATAASAPKPNEAPISVLINQVGYEPRAAKIAVVQVRDPEPERPATFEVISQSGKVVLRGNLLARGRVHEGTASDWGARYWTGDFTALAKPGQYRIQVPVGASVVSSFPFQVAKRVLVPRTAEAAARFYYWERCGFAIPGIHAACHLDDARIPPQLGGGHRDVTGGWHDAGDYNKYNGFTPHSVYALAVLARNSRGLLPAGARARIVEESRWGADFILKMWRAGTGTMYFNVFAGWLYWGPPEHETDNIVGTKDDRPIEGQGPNPMAAAGLAALARITGEARYRDAAEDLWRGADRALESAASPSFTAELLLADLELERLVVGGPYREAGQRRVKRLVAQAGPDGLWPPDMVRYGMPPASLALYAKAHPNDSTQVEIRSALKRWLDRSLELADNPFQITPWTKGVFFNPGKDMGGQNSQYLSQAWALLLVGDLLGDPRAAAMAGRQIDWVLGANPYDVCLMEGQGSFNYPHYHHAYTGSPERGMPGIPGQERGALPGAIANGLCRPQPDLDKPWADFIGNDFRSTEPWLPHNAFYILASSRDLLAEKMTAHQIAEAQRQAREWKPKPAAGSAEGR